MKDNIKILDCTLRDGGYYNNWDFKKKLVNDYLNAINKAKIQYVELGFRTLDKKKIEKSSIMVYQFIQTIPLI